MARRDLRPEQVKLLRFERLITQACREKIGGKKLNKASVLAGLPLVAAAGAGAAAKLGTDAPLRFAADIEAAAQSAAPGEAWLTQLAEVVTAGHNAIQDLAEKGSWLLIHGTPKDPPAAEVVKSLLTNGLF